MSDEPDDDVLPLLLIVAQDGKAQIVQNTMSNADVVRHLRFIAAWVDSMPEELGQIRPSFPEPAEPVPPS